MHSIPSTPDARKQLLESGVKRYKFHVDTLHGKSIASVVDQGRDFSVKLISLENLLTSVETVRAFWGYDREPIARVMGIYQMIVRRHGASLGKRTKVGSQSYCTEWEKAQLREAFTRRSSCIILCRRVKGYFDTKNPQVCIEAADDEEVTGDKFEFI